MNGISATELYTFKWLGWHIFMYVLQFFLSMRNTNVVRSILHDSQKAEEVTQMSINR